MRKEIEVVAAKVFSKLIECYYSETPYYLSNNVPIFKTEEDEFFITDEEIIKYVKKLLSEKYKLEIIPTSRVFKSSKEGVEDFWFEDVELKICLA